MKNFHCFLLISFLLMNCAKEKKFADDIVLTFPKDTKMKIQEFNEDGNDGGTNLLYIGKINPKIDVKYYRNIIAEPPPPPYKHESENDYSFRVKAFKDSLASKTKSFFRREEISLLDSKNDNFIDSLSNKNLEIIVKENDTIPLYKREYDTKVIKKYKAFPVFIKNISGRVLKIPTDWTNVAFYFLNDENKYQYLRNSSYMICGTGIDFYSYFELKPDEILIYAYPYFKKGEKRKAKVKIYQASSKEFEISIDNKIIENQRNTFLE